MMKSRSFTLAAILVASLMMIACANAPAQVGVPGPEVEAAPETEAEVAAWLPVEFQGLGFEVVRVERESYGWDVLLRAVDGTLIDVDVNTRGAWTDVTLERGRELPRALVERLLPTSILTHPVFLELRFVDDVERHGWGFEVEGIDARGVLRDLEFSADGRLLDDDRERGRERGDGAWRDGSGY